MNSKVADAIGLKTHAVALVWADAAPQGATHFKPGRWGCVMSLFATVAAKGRTRAFDRRPWEQTCFLKMEQNVEGSFLQRSTWNELRRHH